MALRKKRKIIVLSLLLVPGLWYWFSLPHDLFQKPTSTVVFAQNGELLGARIAADEQWRFPLSDSLPEKFTRCILYKEDRYFPYHPGFNPVALVRAAWLNLRYGEVVSGGSTISMQVIRLSRNNPARTVWEKLYEIILATRLELRYSKDEILNLYASHAPFGGNVVGFETAAWRYFNRRPQDLSWAECASLAVLPNAPGLIHPGRNRKAFLEKRNKLLRELFKEGVMDGETYRLSLLEQIPDQPAPLPDRAPHLLALFNDHPGSGKKHFTSIDPYLQSRATALVNSHIRELSANRIHNGALMLVDNENGEVKAYVGNVDPSNETAGAYNDMLQAGRSSGSILKPFLYASMLGSGDLLPQELVPDIPTFLGGFKPENYVKEFDGAVPAGEALARSLNIPAVLMLKDYSVDRFLTRLRQFGFGSMPYSAKHYGLSLILGGAEVTAWDLARAYYSMAAKLQRYNASGDQDFEIPDIGFEAETGGELEVPVNPGAIYQTFKVMTTVNRPDSEMGWQKFGRPDIAWKTGTSFGFRDAWAVGITSEYTCVVWVGNASGEGRPGLIGAQAAGPLLFDFMNELPRVKWFETPYNDMEELEICTRSGLLAGRDCEQVEQRWVPLSHATSGVCRYHRLVHTNTEQQYQLTVNCAGDEEVIADKWFVLPPEQAWYYAGKHPDYRPLPPWKAGCGSEQAPLLQVIYPKEKGRIFIPKELSGEEGRVVVEVAHQRPSEKLYWHLNGEYRGETRTFHRMAFHLPEGRYNLLVEDTDGHRTHRVFEVVEKD